MSFLRRSSRPAQSLKNEKHTRRERRFVEHLEERLLLTASESYTWQNAVIGAGGFVDGVFFDPNNNGVMYARTDIGGLYKSTNGGNNWQQLLDFVGNTASTSGNGTGTGEFQVLSFAIDPENSNDLFALVGGNGNSGNNGNVLYSTNAGQTWSVSSPSGLTVNGNGTARGTGERIAVDPNDSNIVITGTNGATGLWESTNSGQTFTKMTATGLPSDDVDFVEFDPYGGTKGSPSQTIFVGVTAKTSGSNIYESTNGGTSFTEVGNTGGPASLYPTRVAFDSSNDGDVYFAYSNQLPPEGTVATNGGVWRYNVNTSTWANITPTLPSGTTTSGFVGLGVDAENPGTVVVTTFDHYSTGDFIFRTTNANAATPTWVSLFGGDSTRNTNLAPYIAAFTDGIGNWAATAAIDPFNPAHIVYGTGQGLWTTLTGNSSSTLTAANSWYFLDLGIEFTSVLDLATPASGNPLLSGVGDVNGFVGTTLTSSPAAGAIAATISGGGIGNLTSIDFAQSNPNIEAVVGASGQGGAYSTNDGATWTAFSTSEGTSGSVAVSANGTTLLWAPSGKTPFYSTNDGATWTASTMPSGTLTGGKVVSDRVNSNQFYYWTENSSDNSWQLYISTNGGQTFTADGAAQGNGNVTLIANPFTSGDLWFSSYNGIWHSTNSGFTFSQISSVGYAVVSSIALGAPAPGQTNPALYMYGTLNGFLGFYRSDDGGSTWVQISTTSQQFGGLINTMAADPNVFGRVYAGVNGSGIEIGDPTNALPAGWSDADINTPGNPGWATSSTTLSTGTVVNQWTVAGGGAGITGTSDQFNFASESITGSASISAELTGLTNGDGSSGTPLAGVMVRASTNAGDPFAAMVQTASGTLDFEYRTTSGGSITTTSLGSVPVGAEFVEIVRSGNNFSGYYSSNGSSWTQLGSTILIAAIPTTANAGLAASASYNPQLTDATFTNVTVGNGPTVATAAAANPNPVTATSTALTVLGAENGNDTGLTYTWSYTGPTGVTYTGNTNGANAAKSITANFTQAGSYTFTATIKDSGGLFTTSQIAVAVNQTPTTIVVSPASSPVVPVGFSQQFSATATDQFGNAISLPSFNWGIGGSGNSISGSGDATLGSTPGSFIVTATDGSAQGMATVIAENFAVPAGSTLDINLGSAGPVSLSASGGNITASQNSVQITLSGFTSANVTDTASSDVLNFNGPLALPFAFVNTSSSTINVNSGTLTFAANVGGTVNVGTLSIANSAGAMITSTTTNSPTTLTLNSLSIAAGGTLDVTNNQVVIADPGGVPHDSSYATILGEVANGLYNGAAGYTSAPGGAILSSTKASGYGLGAVDGNDGVAGTPVSVNTIEIAYALYGDSNLDGKVDATDFGIFSPNFGQSTTLGWEAGDYNYDGKVDATDFGLFAPNFGQQAELSTTFVAATTAVTTTTTSTTTSTTAAAVVPASTVNTTPVTTTTTTPTLVSTKPAQSSVLSGTSNGGSNPNVTVTSSHGSTKKSRHKH